MNDRELMDTCFYTAQCVTPKCPVSWYMWRPFHGPHLCEDCIRRFACKPKATVAL